jgi:hypothetical protein
LTAEEKAAKLEELRSKLKEKRARQSEQDKEDEKKNEVCCHPFSYLFILSPCCPFAYTNIYSARKFAKNPPGRLKT